MAGNANYYYKDGKLPEQIKLAFREHGVLTVQGFLLKMHLVYSTKFEMCRVYYLNESQNFSLPIHLNKERHTNKI